MRNSAARLIATWFGCGYAPAAPGTAGSLAAAAIAWSLARFAGWHPFWFGALALAVTPLAVWAADVTARREKDADPRIVVVDEVVGQWLALAGAASLDGISVGAGFALFRLFDIWKPPPVRQLERLHGGAGVVADDLAAGAGAALVLFLAGCFNLY